MTTITLRYEAQENEADHDPIPGEMTMTNSALFQVWFEIDVKYPPKYLEVDIWKSNMRTPKLQCNENGNLLFKNHRRCESGKPCWCELLDNLIWCGEGRCEFPLIKSYSSTAENYIVKIHAKLDEEKKVISMKINFDWKKSTSSSTSKALVSYDKQGSTTFYQHGGVGHSIL